MADIVPLLNDNLWEVRVNATKAVVQVGVDAVPHLRAALKQDEYHLRMRAMNCLRKIGPDARAASPEIVALVMGGSRDFANEGVATLLRTDPEALIAVVQSKLHDMSDAYTAQHGISSSRRRPS